MGSDKKKSGKANKMIQQWLPSFEPVVLQDLDSTIQEILECERIDAEYKQQIHEIQKKRRLNAIAKSNWEALFTDEMMEHKELQIKPGAWAYLWQDTDGSGIVFTNYTKKRLQRIVFDDIAELSAGDAGPANDVWESDDPDDIEVA